MAIIKKNYPGTAATGNGRVLKVEVEVSTRHQWVKQEASNEYLSYMFCSKIRKT